MGLVHKVSRGRRFDEVGRRGSLITPLQIALFFPVHRTHGNLEPDSTSFPIKAIYFDINFVNVISMGMCVVFH